MKRLFSFVLALCISAALFANPPALTQDTASLPNTDIKNIIVMIPDGMSVDGLALARWYKAYNSASKTVDTSVTLTLDELASGLVRTWWSDGKIIGAVVDSAPAATAYASGIKTNDKFVGVTPESIPVATILEAARLIGKSTGIIATSNIQHATPAGYSSHYNDRSKYDIIGEQQAYNGIDIVMGGGSMYLISPYRKDSENIIDEIKAMGYQYITTRSELIAIKSGRIWGMFAPDAMAYDMDRAETTNTEPSLAEMTAKAIELLSQNANGFFLMVEGSKVDWTAHANDPVGLISDILAFDAAVKVALDFAKTNQNTMILIMSDHGNGGITIGNTSTDSSYSKDPVEKFIVPLKKATLTGEGVAKKFNANRTNIAEVMTRYFGLDDLSAEETAAIRATKSEDMNYTVGPMISKRAALGWTTTGHTGEEVNLFSYLPGNGRIVGTLDNTDIAHICAGVWGINLAEVTKQLYNDAEPAFKAKGAAVEIDSSVQSGGVITIRKGSVTLVIHENKNYVLRNNQKVGIKSIIVHQDGKFYVPQEVLDMIQ